MSVTIRRTPLEKWIARKIGSDTEQPDRAQIESYQLKKLRDTILKASLNSAFYRELWKGIDPEIKSLSDLNKFPFTTEEHITDNPLRFLCVSQDEISRVVTLDTTGTTGNSKRLYFTAADQELTIDFFGQGMSTLVEKGDRVLILLPGERPGSVGDLLATALRRIDVTPVPHGIVRNMPEVLGIIKREMIDSIVGIPVQVLALAKYAEARGIECRLKSVLLSTDNASASLVRELERMWQCRVFDHYGMTEMGLGGGVECEAHDGYHLREADIYFEVVDDKGNAVPDGQYGEIVFTTLTREGMPLVRYRTGDISRFLPGNCSCGTVLRRLDKIARRKRGIISIGDHHISMPELDDALFEVPGLVNFTASARNENGSILLMFKALMTESINGVAERSIRKALDNIPALRSSIEGGKVIISVEIENCGVVLLPGASKRTIMQAD